MSLTLAVWLVLFAILTFFSIFKKASWGFSVYALSFFLSPPFWWWGSGTIGRLRWNLYGGLIFFASVVIENYIRKRTSAIPILSHEKNIMDLPKTTLEYFYSQVKIPPVYFIIGLIVINISIVHFVIAGGDYISQESYFLYLKFLFLFWLIDKSMKTRNDFYIILFSIFLGLTYIGYQVTINDAGHIQGGRLENVGAPGASDANLLACLIVTFLPVCGALIFSSPVKWLKYLAVAGCPFIFNLVLLCNSRGAFLACILAGIFLLIFTRGKEFKIVFTAAVLVFLACFFLLKDARIIERFTTTFIESEDRDSSAGNRIIFWGAALDMIQDYPLGEGGNAFKDKHSINYLSKVHFESDRGRAIHNGYLNEAAEWGIQGLLLKLFFLCITSIRAYKASAIHYKIFADYRYSFLGKTLIAGMITFGCTTMFLDSLDAEWVLWLCAIMLFYTKDIKREIAELIKTKENSKVAQSY